MDYFHLGTKANGLILAYVGFIGILTQGLGVGVVAKLFTDATLVRHSTAVITIAFLFLITVEDVLLYLAVLVPLVIGGSIQHIIMTSLATKVVPVNDTGTVLGLVLGMHALIRVVSPPIGGVIFVQLGFWSIGLTGFMLTFPLSVYLYLFGINEF